MQSAAKAPFYVYCITRKDTGRFYIGYTNNPARRFTEHAKEAPPRMAADAARLQPFAAHFEMSLLAEAGSQEEAELLEEYFIWKWRATRDAGYNVRESAKDPFTLPFGRRRR